MAKKLISASIATAQTIEAGHISQSIKALTGTEAYDITISGSLEITGSTDINGVLSIPGFSNVSASLATSFDGFPFTGSAGLLGTLDVNGPAGHISASGNISATGNISASGFIKANNGTFNLAGITIDGNTIDYIAPNIRVKNSGLHVFGNGTNGHITASGNISASGAITGDTVTTSGNIQAGGRLLATGRIIGDVSVAAPEGTFTTITNVNTTHVTASGNISASGDIRAGTLRVGVTPDNTNGLFISASTFDGDTRDVQIIYPTHGLHFNSNSPDNHVLTLAGNSVGVRAEADQIAGGSALKVSGSITIVDGHITASGNISASGDLLGGGLNVIGASRMSSSNSPSIVSVLTENDSHPFITGVTTTGPNFRMNLADANASGSAYMAFGRQTGAFGGTGFSTAYTTGSNASQGEIIMTLGKNGPLGSKLDRFIVQSEPGPIASNTDSELTLAVGSSTFSRRIVQGLVQNGTNDSAEFVAGNQDATPGYKKHVLMSFTFNNTSSVAGFASSSLNTGSTARNFNANSIPFGVVAGGLSTAELVDTAFFVDRGGSLGSILPVTASFEISRGGSINMEGHITASGNISASGHLVVDEILIPTFKLITPVDKAATGAPLIKTTGAIDNGNAIVSLGDPDAGDTGSHIKIEPANEKVTFQGLNTTITGSITTTAAGLFQGGKPITTHTSSPISSSLANAGRYHIVHGTLTASIVLDSNAPVGAEYEFFQTSSAGQFLFQSASGTTVISKNGSMRLAQQGSSAVLKKVSTTTFHLMGDLT